MKRARWWIVVGVACCAVGFGHAANLPAQEETGDDLTELVVGLLSDADKDIRALGLEQVRTQAKGKAATRAFAAQLPKLPTDAQVGLLRALADRGDDAARPGVLELLKSSGDESVRVAAIAAVGAVGESGDAALLIERLRGNNKAEQAAARKSLQRLRGDEVGKSICTALETKDAGIPLRVALIEILAERGEKSALDNLLSAAISDDQRVRTAAMAALGKLAEPEQVAGMVRGVLAADSSAERSAAEKCIMFVCHRVNDADHQADALIAAIEQLKPDERAAMLSTLGRVGGAKALVRVEAAIAAEDAKLRDLGIRALCNWPTAAVAGRLTDLANIAEAPEHRTMVLRALIRVAPLSDERTDEQRLALLGKAMSMSQRDEERNLVLNRTRAVRTVEALRFLLPYMENAELAETACESIVELAHHRALRDANKAEFHAALDKVIATSKDVVVVDRANRYKKGQTWVRPKPAS
ncbi:MAG: HEAT repeat domain-containing protein [Pirellulales bacterium]